MGVTLTPDAGYSWPAPDGPDYTVGVWVMPDEIPDGEDDWSTVVYIGGSSFNSYWMVSIEPDGSLLLVDNNNWIAQTPPDAVEVDTWTWVAVTFQVGGTCTLWWRRLTDTTLDSDVSATDGLSTLAAFAGWGRSPSGLGPFPGTLAYGRAWTGILSEQDLMAESEDGDAVETDDLWGDWRFDAAATGTVDGSGNANHLTLLSGFGQVDDGPSPALAAIDATLTAGLPLLEAGLSADIVNRATLTAGLPLLEASLDGTQLLPIEATLTAGLPLLEASLVGQTTPVIEATLTAGLPLLEAALTGWQIQPAPLPAGRRVPWTPTTAQILDLDEVRHRSDRFEFELQDQQGRLMGSLAPDRDRAPVVKNDVGSTIHRTLTSFHLPHGEAADVNPITDQVQVWMRLQNDERFSLGVFRWADSARPQRGWGGELASSLSDKGLLLDQGHRGSLSWAPGGATVGLILLFIALKNFTLDQIAPLPPVVDRGLTEPVSFNPGGTWTRAMTEVGAQVGLVAPWFDRDGILHLTEPPDPDLVSPAMAPYGPGTRVIANSVIESDNLLSAPNVFEVYSSDPNSTARGLHQLPPSAPHSRERRGFEVAMVESVQDLARGAPAGRAARALATGPGRPMEQLEFDSTADPRHDTWDVVTWIDEAGEETRWVETGWTIPCRSGAPMAHKIEKVYS